MYPVLSGRCNRYGLMDTVLYPMVVNKLREYDSAFPKIEENISFNLLNAENNWKLTRDETSYYFTLGYTLSYAIDDNKTDENDE